MLRMTPLSIAMERGPGGEVRLVPQHFFRLPQPVHTRLALVVQTRAIMQVTGLRRRSPVSAAVSARQPLSA